MASSGQAEEHVAEGAISRATQLLAARRTANDRAEAAALCLHAPALVAACIESMGRFVSAPAIQASSCSLLVRLCDTDARREAAVQLGTLGAVASALRAHPTSPEVLEWASLAALILTQASVVRSHFAVEAGVRSALEHAISVVKREPALQAAARIAALAKRSLDHHANFLATQRLADSTFYDIAQLASKNNEGTEAPPSAPSAAEISASMPPLPTGARWMTAWVGEVWDAIFVGPTQGVAARWQPMMIARAKAKSRLNKKPLEVRL